MGRGARYFLVVIKCGTHQVGLTAKGAVTGRAAAVAGGELHKDTPGVCVRLFKFLINDYCHEFAFNVMEWVDKELKLYYPHEVTGDGNSPSTMGRVAGVVTWSHEGTGDGRGY